jgi:cell division protein FtsI/penicillin-binding protein 2
MNVRTAATHIEPGDATLRRRQALAGCCLLAAFSLLSWRLIYLQVERREHYAALVEGKHQRIDQLEAHRGRIFDTRGQLLAGDEPVQKIIFDLGFLRQKEALATALATVEGMKPADIRRVWTDEEMQQRYLGHVIPLLAQHAGRTEAEVNSMIRERLTPKLSGEVVINREMSVQDGIQLRDALERSKLGEYQEVRGRIGAVVFKDSFARRYPATTPLFHFVGKAGEPPGSQNGEQQGVCGIEKFFNEQLKGRPGQRVLVVDGLGNELAAYRGEVKPPVHGANLRTTIDTGLQELVQTEIDLPAARPDELSVAQMHPNRVIVVLFEPKTMALRAVVTRDFTRSENAGPLLVNDLVEYVYEPGSTIKVATISAALSNGKVNPNTHLSIDPDGDRIYDDEDIQPIRDEHAYASLTVEGIMVKSSNIGAYKLARQIGLKRFREYIDALGFAKPTGITLPTEQRGWFPKQWNMQSLSRSAYGYAYSVTPAQMCALLGCVLNDGQWRPLRTVEAWTDEQGRTLETVDPPAATQPITAKASRQVRQMLIQVVEKGTAKLARSEVFEIGGKTGTANKINPLTKGYDDHRQVVSFLGFISGNDGPRLGGIVIIDEPRLAENLNYGGRLAAPLFRRIAEKAMAYYGVPALFAVNERAAEAAGGKKR